jgi:hypothetical protein
LLAVQSGTRKVLVYCDYEVISEDGVRRTVSACPPHQLLPTLRYRSTFMPSVVAVRREAFVAVGGFDKRLNGADDWDLWIRLVMRYGSESFAHVRERLVDYYIVPNCLTHQTRNQLAQYLRLVDGSLLDGLTGWSRRVWRRKILARIYRDAAVALRGQDAPDYLKHMRMSLFAWPFPSAAIQGDRYKIAASMALKALKSRIPLAR